MNKRLKQKSQKADKQKDMKQKVEEQEIDSIKHTLGKTFGSGGFFKADYNDEQEEGEDDDELLRKLKEWRMRRYQLKKRDEERQLGETVVDLDPLMIKKLVMKLDSLERSLRELRRLKGLTGKVERQPVMNLQKLKSDSSAFTMDYFDQHSKIGTVRAVSHLDMDIPPVITSPKLATTTKNVNASQSPEIAKNISLLDHNSKSSLKQASEVKSNQNFNTSSNKNLNSKNNNLNTASNELKVDSNVNKNLNIEAKQAPVVANAKQAEKGTPKGGVEHVTGKNIDMSQFKKFVKKR